MSHSQLNACFSVSLVSELRMVLIFFKWLIKNGKNNSRALNRPHEGYICMYSLRTGTRQPSISLLWPQLGTCVLGDSNFLLLCACPQMTVKMLWILTWGLHIHCSKSENSETRNIWIMRIHCTCPSFLLFTRLWIHWGLVYLSYHFISSIWQTAWHIGCQRSMHFEWTQSQFRACASLAATPASVCGERTTHGPALC